MEAFASELRLAVRALLHAPSYSLITLSCFVLGLGGTATMFGVIDSLFFRPPSMVHDPDSVVRLYFRLHPRGFGEITTDLTSFPIYESLREHPEVGQAAAYQTTLVSEGLGANALKLRAALVTETYFPVLGVAPAVGRLIIPSDTGGSGGAVAVVSDGLWRRQFGGRSDITSQRLHIAGREYVIVGVAPRDFLGLDLEPVDVWLPMQIAANDLIMPAYTTKRGAMAISEIVRLRSGITNEQAAVAATVAYRNTVRSWWEVDSAARIVVAPLLRELGPKQTDQARVAKWLAGVSLAVLLIAGMNCTNLMLLRALRREPEFAVRAALGATRAGIARLLIVENTLLAACGAILATTIAIATGRIFGRFFLPEIAADVGSISRLTTYTFTVAMATAVLASLIPVWAVVRRSVAQHLAAHTRTSAAGLNFTRTAISTGQAAVAMVLLVGAGLFATSLRNVNALDLGFQVDGVAAVTLDFNSSLAVRASSPIPPDVLYREIADRLRAIPGVSAVAIATSIPFQHAPVAPISIPNRDPQTLPKLPVSFTVASEDYRRTIGLGMTSGRWFTSSDYGRNDEDGTVVVSESMSKAYWPGDSPLGQCIVVGVPPCRQVVGVAQDIRQSNLREDRQLQVYVPDISDVRISSRLPRTILIRSARGKEIIGVVRTAIQAADPGSPYITVQGLDALIAPAVRPWKLGATAFAFFAGLAVVLAAIGLYGTMNSLVAERSRELAVRVALGAGSRNVTLLVLRRAAVITVAGMAAGAACALWAGSSISALLFKVGARDPGTFGVAAATLFVAAIAACYSPIRKVARLEPMAVLRQS